MLMLKALSDCDHFVRRRIIRTRPDSKLLSDPIAALKSSAAQKLPKASMLDETSNLQRVFRCRNFQVHIGACSPQVYRLFVESIKGNLNVLNVDHILLLLVLWVKHSAARHHNPEGALGGGVE